MQTKKATSNCSDQDENYDIDAYHYRILLATKMQHDTKRQMQEIAASDDLPRTDNLRKLEELIKKQQQTASSKEFSVSTARECELEVSIIVNSFNNTSFVMY